MKCLKCLLQIFILLLFVTSCKYYNKNSKICQQILKGKGKETIISGEPSIRGLYVVNEKIIWLSGTNAKVFRSIDSGISWNHFEVGGNLEADFRDIHAFDADIALVLTSGSPARIYKTENGGLSWKLCYENTDTNIFCNAMDFWDNKTGLVCGDPLNGYHFILKTEDQGNTWHRINKDSLPAPLKKEAGFAASGTAIKCFAKKYACFGMGGDSTRIIATSNKGNSWKAVKTPVISGATSQGIYSLDFCASGIGVAVGGDWQRNNWAEKNFAISLDKGQSWYLAGLPSGFRSCIKFLPTSGHIVSCGPSGVDISMDNGKTWKKAKVEGFHSFAVSPNGKLAVFSGSKGRVKIITI